MVVYPAIKFEHDNEELKHTFLFLSCILVSFSGCKKEEPISNVPSIKFISMTPNPAVKYQDEIKVTIEYRDGDGDLGENTPDVKTFTAPIAEIM